MRGYYGKNRTSSSVGAWPQTKALIHAAIGDVSGAGPSRFFVWSLEKPPEGYRSATTGQMVVALEPTSLVAQFDSADEATAYLHAVAQERRPTALALFDRTSSHWPNPIRWSTSSDPDRDQVIAQHLASRSAPAVGASIWQTPGGVVSEINRINDDIALFSAEITTAVRNRGYKTADPMTTNSADFAFWDTQRAGHPDPKDPLVDFFKSTWMQFATSWRKFLDDNGGWSDNFWWNHAPEAEQFHDQLIELRKAADGLGMKVATPDPKTFGKSVLFDPRKNVFDEAHDAAKEGAQDVWKLLKYGVYGALGIAGVLAVTSIVQQLRKDRDPLESYVGLARARALPRGGY